MDFDPSLIEFTLTAIKSKKTPPERMLINFYVELNSYLLVKRRRPPERTPIMSNLN